MNLIIDIGNTRSKLALFNSNQLEVKEATQMLTSAQIEKFTEGYTIDNAILCAVGPIPNKELRLPNSTITLDQNTALPIFNKYNSKATLGYDRIASVVGASMMITNREILCIDIGTCITYDMLDNKKNYLGGGISPGLDIRFRALNNFTENLPLITLDENEYPVLVGTTTEESIKSGVFNGVLAEINGLIIRYQEEYPNVAIVLTGGNAILFESYIKSEIFAFPDSVLHGLNAILEYNKSQ
ncbi:MAG: type III pantothenate kinase [Chitinophagales bacterium]|nr:type III pantothenate kinase [Chitinophagales bacterium]